MRLIAITATLAGLIGCASAEPTGPAALTSDSPECPVLVRFGSYASGIDRPAAEAVAAALRADRRVSEVAVRPWGREGERDLCVTPRRAVEARALVTVAQRALPEGGLNGYVDILLNGRRVFTTQNTPAA